MFPVLFTPRLLLRPLNGDDFEGYAALMADPEQMRHLGGTVPREVAWRDLTLRAGAWMTRGFSMFAVIERGTDEFVGRVGPWQPEGWPGTEVGWGIGSRFVGQGYALEAAAAAMNYAVDVLGWTEIIHTIAPDNHRSIRLAERLGSTNGGPSPYRHRSTAFASIAEPVRRSLAREKRFKLAHGSRPDRIAMRSGRYVRPR